MRFSKRDHTKIEIPEHLMRAPIDTFATSRPRTRSPSVGKKGKKLTLAEKKEREVEMKRRATAEKHLNNWLRDLFTALAKDDDDNYSSQLRIKIKLLKE